ncbi:hypothetical protein EJ03DRAFT_366031 [Teratosphaeria nubilosa]|uniref:PIN domain-containing protein n=1 Tax=Teratosphaeria nubilosa TaxID=161662 RepID=A0A6G1L3D2_9PEZI|nr:hypothetical protein EJ03DRAFT_366031 [Teratosphaeria nubilosa]
MAHDIAGIITLWAHLIHGSEFSSLVLLDTNTVLPRRDGMYQLIRSEPQVFIQLPLPIFEAVVRAMTRSAMHRPDQAWEDTRAEPRIGSGNAQRSFARPIAQANDADLAEMLDQDMYEKVRCDVQVMWAEQD